MPEHDHTHCIETLLTLIEDQRATITDDDYEEFHGFALDAKNDPVKADCIHDYLEELAHEQGCEIDEVDLTGKDGNDLFDMYSERQ